MTFLSLLSLALISLSSAIRTVNVVDEKDLPKSSAWSHPETLSLAHEQLGRCIDPEDTQQPFSWLSKFQQAASDHDDTTWVESYTRQLDLPLGEYIPHHRAIGLTSNRSTILNPGGDLPESQCYTFDYDTEPGTLPDPNGCSLFRKSFSRLKTLRKCIVRHLNASERWQKYREVVTSIRLGRPDGSIDEPNPSLILPEDVKAVPLKLYDIIKNCVAADNKEKRCVLLDANRRADEMIKYLSFRPWSELKKPLLTYVQDKVRYTASVYYENAGKVTKDLGLADHTVNGIVHECLQVPANANSLHYDELPFETRMLERSLRCNPLMWDSLEVPGAPEPPVVDAAHNWGNSLKHQAKLLFQLRRTPPVCGRAAAALSVWPQAHAASYNILSCHGFPFLQPERIAWSSCVQPTTFNCICMEKCWRAALRRVCELTEDGSCCQDVEA